MRDRQHYGRHRLFDYLLHTSDTAIWVVGARRIGKTSLLRQLEFLTDRPDSNLVPLFWDLQGCETSGDLAFELFLSLEDVRERFERHDIRVESYEGQDAVLILRRLNRQLANQGKTLLLLVDEAEVLISVARQESAWLARLRRGLQDGHQKTIIASTKLLTALNDATAHWETSPFLFGFNMVNLWSLDSQSTVELIEQQQTDRRVVVDPVVLEDIVIHTNRHPYLVQFLCQRLFTEDDQQCQSLRAPADADLEPDQLLAGFFLIDFQHMTRLERRVLLTIAERTLMGETEVLAAIADTPPTRVRAFLWGLEKLGHVRRLYGQYAIGNEFLRRWLFQEWDRLQQLHDEQVSDANLEKLLEIGQAQEARVYGAELERLQAAYDQLKRKSMEAGASVSPEISNELIRVERYLDATRRDLAGTWSL